MKEFAQNHAEMAWEEAAGYPTGTLMKVLRQDGEQKTFLLKLPAGFDMEAHCHTPVTEQHIVLEGSYTGQGTTYGVGSYRLIPPGVTHGPFTSDRGAVLLVIWGS